MPLDTSLGLLGTLRHHRSFASIETFISRFAGMGSNFSFFIIVIDEVVLFSF